MFVKETSTGDLIRIEAVEELASPLSTTIVGRRQAGEEEQDSQPFPKADLEFPSGEPLPRCWQDESYQIDSIRPARSAE